MWISENASNTAENEQGSLVTSFHLSWKVKYVDISEDSSSTAENESCCFLETSFVCFGSLKKCVNGRKF
jgi:hypothetical protein